jgi:endonuclease/exonuclease/phosphatase family metal-dependent hydrolase
MVTLPAAQHLDCHTVVSPDPFPIVWVVPDDERQRARLDEYCRAIGPVAVAAGPAATPPTDELALVTWTTYLGRGDLDRFFAAFREGAFTTTPPRAFVLLLQEVYREELAAFARGNALHAVFAPTRRRAGEDDDRGTAIVSTQPIHGVRIVELPFEKQRRLAVAGVLDGAAADGGPWRLHVTTVHFDTNVGLFRGGPGAARRRHARAVLDAIADLPSPLVLAGDLNTWWGDDEPAVKMMRRALPDARPLKARETWRGPLGVGNKLDYVFARGTAAPVTVERAGDRFGSDHWPLIAVVRLR